MENRDTSQISHLYESVILLQGELGKPMHRHHDHGIRDNEGEVDPGEIHMARSELKKLAEYSAKLYDKIGELDSIEGWVASKITKASDYISSAYHWIEYEGDDECCDECETDF